VQAAAGATASASSAASSPEGRIYTLNELPDDVRRELPALTIGGAMYSANPANRMLIINGQLFHEGDKLAPGLSLEQIKLKSAVLKLKGYRYGISY
jgi:general secretion pathway protein B